MKLADDVDLEEFVMAKDELSGADIKVYFYIMKRLFALKLDCWHSVNDACVSWLMIYVCYCDDMSRQSQRKGLVPQE